MRFIFQFKLASILEARSFHTRSKGIHSVAHDHPGTSNGLEGGSQRAPGGWGGGAQYTSTRVRAFYSEDLFIFINQIASPPTASSGYHTAAACALLYLSTHHTTFYLHTQTHTVAQHSCFSAVTACKSPTKNLHRDLQFPIGSQDIPGPSSAKPAARIVITPNSHTFTLSYGLTCHSSRRMRGGLISCSALFWFLNSPQNILAFPSFFREELGDFPTHSSNSPHTRTLAGAESKQIAPR